MNSSQRVLVAMSGGVDSSVAALLLKEQGYDVVGVHMKLWDYAQVGGDLYRDGRCCSLDSITDCRFVCDAIGAPFYVMNLSERFKEDVIDDFVAEYRAGRTPNPCVRCNSLVKWDAFLHKAEAVGCDYVATGHYSFVEQNNSGRWQIRKGKDASRDQSYVLWGLSQEALSKTLMPLGGLLKSEVRDLARQHNLRTADKSESREICFVADDDYRRFLREQTEQDGVASSPGEIVLSDGRVLGEHQGTEMFTIGQRRGLKISHPTPLYVKAIDPAQGRVVVGDDAELYSTQLIAEQINWVAGPPTLVAGPSTLVAGPLVTDGPKPGSEFKAAVKIRYLHPPAVATITLLPDSLLRVDFNEAQRAITPGQSVAFYDGDVLLGGGLIVSAGA